MSIHGSLREATLPDVLQLLAMGRKTGCLSLAHRNNLGSIYFESGRITFASIVNRRDRLGERLVQAGLITREALGRVVEQQGSRADVRVGDLLAEQGLIAPAALSEHLRIQIEETVYLLYTWTDGTFNFAAGARPRDQDVLVSISPESLMLEGARRVDEWSLIQETVPAFDIVFSVDLGVLHTSGGVTPEQRAVLDHLDGVRDLAAVVDASGLSEFDVGKAIHELVAARIVRALDRRTSSDRRELSAARVDEHRNLGVAFYRTSMFEEALRELRRVLDLKPGDEEASAYLTLALLRQRRWDEAAEACRRLTQSPTARPSALHNLALALEQQGRYDEARDALLEALRRGGNGDPRILTSLGAVLLCLGDPRLADETLAQARALWTTRPNASWFHYASLAAAWVGDLGRAQALLEESVALYPRVAALHNNLVALLERRNTPNDALAAAQRALASDESLPQLHKNSGDLYYRHGRYDEAGAAFRHAVSLDPGLGPDVYLKLGNIALRKRDHDTARKCWTTARDLDPDNEIVRTNLRTLDQIGQHAQEGAIIAR